MDHNVPHTAADLAVTLPEDPGMLGRVRKLDERSKVIQADFEYALDQPLPLQVDDDCVIHPMFYERFRIDRRDGFTVLPFPDKPEFDPIRTHSPHAA